VWLFLLLVFDLNYTLILSLICGVLFRKNQNTNILGNNKNIILLKQIKYFLNFTDKKWDDILYDLPKNKTLKVQTKQFEYNQALCKST